MEERTAWCQASNSKLWVENFAVFFFFFWCKTHIKPKITRKSSNRA